MNDHPRLRMLQALYTIHDRVAAGLDTACRKGCAACCTRNVTMTTLEGRLMLSHLNETGPAAWPASIRAASEKECYRPRITINQLAGLCAAGREIPEESVDPLAGPCPLLTDGTCPVYAVRPFGCRAMLSTIACGTGGAADMPDFVLSVNTVFQQYIEALDAGGCSGNMLDVLIYVQERFQHRPGAPLDASGHGNGRRLIPNLPIPVLMVPPEHRPRMAPIMAAIRQAFGNDAKA
jgi:Fe-S-cluster containining protein